MRQLCRQLFRFSTTQQETIARQEASSITTAEQKFQ